MAVPNRSPLTAADVMTPNPLTCDAASPVVEAVRIFRDADCGAVPVTETGRLVGVLTDRDVALALADYEDDLPAQPVGKITSPGVVAVGPDTPLDVVIARFGDKGVRRLLVIDASGRLLGIIGWSDVAPHAPDAKVGRAVSRVVKAD